MKRAPPKSQPKAPAQAQRKLYVERSIDAYLDELTADAREQLEAWPDEEQERFHELLEDAASELQRELLGRALAAGHEILALHGFADALRPLSDEEAFAACTLSEKGSASARSVVARLRAEADPLFAFQANGFSAGAPGEPEDEEASFDAPRRQIPAALLAPLETPSYARPPRPTFDEESRAARPRAPQARSLGESPESSRVTGATSTGRVYATELYSEAAKALGIAYREEGVDSPRLSLEKALDRVAEALGRNLLVPAAIGGEVGEFRKDILILQVQPAGKGRSFQLHDPFAGETVWAHEKDLLGRMELPFKDKRNRRVTAVSLPVSPKTRE